MDEARLAETKRHNLEMEKVKPVDSSKVDKNEAYAVRAKIAKEKWDAEQEQLGNMPLGDGRAVKFQNPLAHTTKEAQSFREQAATTYALNKQLDRLEQLVRSVPPGSKVFPTEMQAALQAARSGVIAQTNKALGLGAITQGHQDLLMNTIQDPTKPLNAANIGRVLVGIEDMRQNTEMNLQGHARTLGGHIVTMGDDPGDADDAPTPPRNLPAPHGDTVRQGGFTYQWNGAKYVPEV